MGSGSDSIPFFFPFLVFSSLFKMFLISRWISAEQRKTPLQDNLPPPPPKKARQANYLAPPSPTTTSGLLSAATSGDQPHGLSGEKQLQQNSGKVSATEDELDDLSVPQQEVFGSPGGVPHGMYQVPSKAGGGVVKGHEAEDDENAGDGGAGQQGGERSQLRNPRFFDEEEFVNQIMGKVERQREKFTGETVGSFEQCWFLCEKWHRMFMQKHNDVKGML